MEDRPFAEINLSDLKSEQLEQIEQLSKSMFKLETLLSTAGLLKYLRGVKEEKRAGLTDPSCSFVWEMARQVNTAERA